MQVRIEALSVPEMQALLEEPLQDMAAWSPPGSVHALVLTGLHKPEITCWALCPSFLFP